MFEVAGSYGPILLGLGGLGALVALVSAVVGIMGKRVPLLVWLFIPMVLTVVGAFASYTATGAVETSLNTGGIDIGVQSSVGMAGAYGARWLAHWTVAAVAAFSIWCAAGSALVKPGGETRATPFVAIVVFLIAALSPAGTLYFVLSKGLGMQALVFIGLVSLAGVGCALIAFRRALHEAAYRVASLRFAAGILMVFTAAHGARALVLQGTMDRLFLRASTPFEGLVEATSVALAQQANIVTLCWVMFAIGLAMALFTFLGEMAEVVDKMALFDGVAVLAALAVVGGIRTVETVREAEMLQTASVHPIGGLLTQYGFQLPAAAVNGFTGSFDLRGEESMFGDIVVWGTRPSYQPPTDLADGEVPPTPPLEWYRAFKWSGNSWVADDTPIAEVTPNEAYPTLIAGPGSTTSQDLVMLLETLGGQAHVLMRVSELTAQIAPELAWTDARWLHIELTDGIDFSTESYVHTERYEPYVGVARFIGAQRRNDKPIHRLDHMFEDTGITTVRATVGERTRLDHIANFCLSTHVVPGLEPELDDVEEPPTLREGITCTVVNTTIDEAIAAATAELGLPESDVVRMTVEVQEGLDAASADVVRRELEAFGACAAQVQEDMGMQDKITGRLAGSFTVDDRGRAGRFEFEEERRDIDIYDMKLCVRERLEGGRFPEYVAPELPEVVPTEGEDVEEEPPPPPPRVSFVLNYR